MPVNNSAGCRSYTAELFVSDCIMAKIALTRTHGNNHSYIKHAHITGHMRIQDIFTRFTGHIRIQDMTAESPRD